MFKLSLQTQHREDIIDITSLIAKHISDKSYQSGIILVYSPHTTAGISVNENADPDVKRDITHFLNTKIPQQFDFHHYEGNSDSHIKGSLVNFSQSFIIENGKLQLGTWQGIHFMEFDGPRKREIWLKFIPG